MKGGDDGKRDDGKRLKGDLTTNGTKWSQGASNTTNWKEMKTMFEEIVGVSKATYRRVKVIGERSPSAIIQFEGYDD